VKTDLAKVAEGFGIGNILTVSSEAGLKDAADFVKIGEGPRFLWLRVLPGEPTKFKRNMNPAECRVRFRAHFASA
jgi:hypothetical protein